MIFSSFFYPNILHSLGRSSCLMLNVLLIKQKRSGVPVVPQTGMRERKTDAPIYGCL